MALEQTSRVAWLKDMTLPRTSLMCPPKWHVGDDRWFTTGCLKGKLMSVGHISASVGSLNKLDDAGQGFLRLFDTTVNNAAQLASCRKDDELQSTISLIPFFPLPDSLNRNRALACEHSHCGEAKERSETTWIFLSSRGKHASR